MNFISPEIQKWSYIHNSVCRRYMYNIDIDEKLYNTDTEKKVLQFTKYWERESKMATIERKYIYSHSYLFGDTTICYKCRASPWDKYKNTFHNFESQFNEKYTDDELYTKWDCLKKSKKNKI